MKTIKLPQELIEAVALLPTELRTEIYDVVFTYIVSGVVPGENSSPEVRAIFLLSKKSVDRANGIKQKIVDEPKKAEETKSDKTTVKPKPTSIDSTEPPAEYTPQPLRNNRNQSALQRAYNKAVARRQKHMQKHIRYFPH